MKPYIRYIYTISDIYDFSVEGLGTKKLIALQFLHMLKNLPYLATMKKVDFILKHIIYAIINCYLNHKIYDLNDKIL